MDVDCFLRKDDFMRQFDLHTWPWILTHFILSEKCHGCGRDTDSFLPYHFALNKKDIKIIIKLNFFWCKGCCMAVYDHYIHDECDYCF